MLRNSLLNDRIDKEEQKISLFIDGVAFSGDSRIIFTFHYVTVLIPQFRNQICAELWSFDAYDVILFSNTIIETSARPDERRTSGQFKAVHRMSSRDSGQADAPYGRQSGQSTNWLFLLLSAHLESAKCTTLRIFNEIGQEILTAPFESWIEWTNWVIQRKGEYFYNWTKEKRNGFNIQRKKPRIRTVASPQFGIDELGFRRSMQSLPNARTKK
jgi:hypothetical protein